MCTEQAALTDTAMFSTACLIRINSPTFLFLNEVCGGRIRGCLTAEITSCENDLQEAIKYFQRLTTQKGNMHTLQKSHFIVGTSSCAKTQHRLRFQPTGVCKGKVRIHFWASEGICSHMGLKNYMNSDSGGLHELICQLNKNLYSHLSHLVICGSSSTVNCNYHI